MLSLFAVFTLFLAMATVVVSAQETDLSGKQVASATAASSTPLSINTSGVAATKTISVKCPKACYLRISLSALFDGITQKGLIAGVVYVDGTETLVVSSNPVGLDSTSTGSYSQSRGYTCFSQVLDPGPHTIDVGLYMTKGTAGSFSRSVTVDVMQETK